LDLSQCTWDAGFSIPPQVSVKSLSIRIGAGMTTEGSGKNAIHGFVNGFIATGALQKFSLQARSQYNLRMAPAITLREWAAEMTRMPPAFGSITEFSVLVDEYCAIKDLEEILSLFTSLASLKVMGYNSVLLGEPNN
jgi:hypothetical protein